MQPGGRKKAVDYSIDIHRSEAEANSWVTSMCSSGPEASIKDAGGSEVGKVCPSMGGLYIQQGNKAMRINEPGKYQLTGGAIAANNDDLLAFAKALPMNAGLEDPRCDEGNVVIDDAKQFVDHCDKRPRNRLRRTRA